MSPFPTLSGGLKRSEAPVCVSGLLVTTNFSPSLTSAGKSFRPHRDWRGLSLNPDSRVLTVDTVDATGFDSYCLPTMRYLAHVS